MKFRPNWFDIANYSSLNVLDNLAIAEQLKIRFSLVRRAGTLLNLINEKGVDSPLVKFSDAFLYGSSYWKLILTGLPILPIKSDEDKYFSDNSQTSEKNMGYESIILELQHREREIELSKKDAIGYDGGVSAVSVSELAKLANFLGGLDVLKISEFEQVCDYPERYTYSSIDKLFYSMDDGFYFHGKAHLSLEIENYSDTELVNEFKSILPILRAKLNCNQKHRLVSESNLEKIKKYNVIAYLDIFLWSLREGVKVTDSDYSDLLSGDSILHEENIKQTVRPYIYSLFTENFQSKLNLYISSKK
jgi:hypothetical protein